MTNDWAQKTITYTILFDLEDFNNDAKMFNRFGRVDVEQQCPLNNPTDIQYWFKGIRTLMFSPNEKRDKQKVQIMKMINDFLLDEDSTIVGEWTRIENLNN
jgi:hypothetical protein